MRRVKINHTVYEPNVEFDVKNSKAPVQDQLAKLSCQKDVNGTYQVTSDISLLFNQKRLANRLSPVELREMFNRYSPNQSAYVSQLDDETLMSTLKSRHVQSLSEMKAWTEYCLENFDNLIKEQNERIRLEQDAAAQAAAASSGNNASGSSAE